jgi:hypothetical protein
MRVLDAGQPQSATARPSSDRDPSRIAARCPQISTQGPRRGVVQPIMAAFQRTCDAKIHIILASRGSASGSREI